MAWWHDLTPPMDWSSHRQTWPHAGHSQFIQTHGQRWHVQLFGTGPVLLLLHGTGASTHTWRDLVLPLSQAMTVISLDLPGHAFTSLHPNRSNSLENMSSGVAAVLKHLKVWPRAIVGHSAGAAVGAHLILHHPEQPAPALLGLNAAWLPLPGLANWLFPPAAKLLALNPFSARLFARQAAKPDTVRQLMASTGSRLDDAGLAHYQRLLQTPSHVQGALAMMAAWNLNDFVRELARLKSPVFALTGSRDRTVPASLAAQTVLHLPHVVSRTLPDLGHLAHEEAPEVHVQQILAWVNRTDH